MERRTATQDSPRLDSPEGPTIRAGVIGLGYFGAFHAEKYATLPGCRLVAVADRVPEKAEQIAMEYEAQAFTDYRDMLELVDVVSVVTPAPIHYSVARDFIEAGVHVLVEKPITETPEQASDLIARAKKKHVVLQVGHLERFNPTFLSLPEELRRPTYIETHRLMPFHQRASNVSVVLDLMIHDIDLVHALMPYPVSRIQAKGVRVYSKTMDLVNAVIQFDNGAVANLTASRVSLEPQRRLHLFQANAYCRMDMQDKSLLIQRRRADGRPKVERVQLEKDDALRHEVSAFLDSVRTASQPLVTGEEGRRALDTALRIGEAVALGSDTGGPLPIDDTSSTLSTLSTLAADEAHVTHDPHPETRKPFFSRTSLVDQRSRLEVMQ